MKFEYIGPNAKDSEGQEIPVNGYGGQKVLNGEAVDLEGNLAKKAEANPDYRRVKPGPKSKREEMFGQSTAFNE